MAKARLWGNWYPESEKGVMAIMCPGCNETHVIATKQPFGNGAVWSFNNDFEKPTFSPSLLIRTGKYVTGHENFDDEGFKGLSSICHSFITDGRIQFLNDCTHSLAGQTVELPEINEL